MSSRLRQPSPTIPRALVNGAPRMAQVAWLTSLDGRDYCRLCWCFASAPHLQAKRHKRRLSLYRQDPWDLDEPAFPWPQPGEPAPLAWGEPHLFQYHAHRKRWYCIACSAYVDAGHLDTPKHRLRSVNSAYWSTAPESEPDESGDGQAAGPGVPHSQERGPGNQEDTRPAYLPTPWGHAVDADRGESLGPSHRLTSEGELRMSDEQVPPSARCCRCKQPMDCAMARRDQALRTSAGSERAR